MPSEISKQDTAELWEVRTECPHCGGKNNSKAHGGNNRCFHCGDCEFTECCWTLPRNLLRAEIRNLQAENAALKERMEQDSRLLDAVELAKLSVSHSATCYNGEGFPVGPRWIVAWEEGAVAEESLRAAIAAAVQSLESPEAPKEPK